jgi:hypothetical protein
LLLQILIAACVPAAFAAGRAWLAGLAYFLLTELLSLIAAIFAASQSTSEDSRIPLLRHAVAVSLAITEQSLD